MLTVGMPMYRVGEIAWLAMEGLCRQEYRRPWELIVCEEQDQGEDRYVFGRERALSYADRLAQIGCERVHYIGIDQWVPLTRKWVRIVEESADDSQGFLLHGADDFSHPERLEDAYHAIVERGFEWCHLTRCLLYDIPTGLAKVYDWRHARGATGPTMAAQMTRLRATIHRLEDHIRGVDAAIFKAMAPRTIKQHEPRHWEMDLKTTGRNNLSMFDAFLGTDGKETYEIDLDPIVGPSIASRLRAMRFKRSVPRIDRMAFRRDGRIGWFESWDESSREVIVRVNGETERWPNQECELAC